MTHKTEFATADFVILEVVKKLEIASFFEKREFFFPWQNFVNTSNLPWHLAHNQCSIIDII